jgi:dipeptidase E
VLLLASRGIPELASFVHGRAVLIPTASDGLDNPGIAAEVEQDLRDAGLSVQRAAIREPLDGFDVIAVSGGNPYRLLAEAQRSAFGARVRASGAVYIGYSAGAIVAGPTLEPITLTSPFPVPDMDLTGLGLTDVLVLPHHNREGRAERHAAAAAAFPQVALRPLNDGEFLRLEDGRGFRAG